MHNKPRYAYLLIVHNRLAYEPFNYGSGIHLVQWRHLALWGIQISQGFFGCLAGTLSFIELQTFSL